MIWLVLTWVLGGGLVTASIPLIRAARRAQALRRQADASGPAQATALINLYPRWAVRLGWILGAQIFLVGAAVLALALDTVILLARA